MRHLSTYVRPLRRLLAALAAAWLLVTPAPLVADPLPVPPGFLHGSKWGPAAHGTGAVVSYSFDTYHAFQTPLADFMPAGYQDDIRAALEAWSAVADIQFVELASGGELRFFGEAIDGPGGVAGQATFPAASQNFVRFDLENTWRASDPGAGEHGNIVELAMHEVGHAIGLLHPPGILARMNHRVSNAYQGLLPSDVAAIQALYGPASGSDPEQYRAIDPTRFVVLPGSGVSVNLNLAPLLDVTQTATLTGSLDARVVYDAAAAPAGVALYAADLDVSDILFSVVNSLIEADVEFRDVKSTLMSDNWFGPAGQLVPINGGQFSPLDTILGLVDGQAEYHVVAPILGLDTGGLFDFEFVNTVGAGPQAFKATDDGRLGSLVRAGSALNLELPISVVTVLDLPTPLGDAPVTISITGTLYALAIVPEPSGITLASIGGLAAAGAAVRRRRSVLPAAHRRRAGGARR